MKHDDSTEANTDDSDSDADDDVCGTGISFHRRRKGPNQPGLDRLILSEERFDKLMSYRYYLLINTKATRTHEETTSLHKTLKNIELTMRDHKFSGEGPILAFDFLTRVI